MAIKMKLIDISGSIYNGMWSYSDNYPKFNLKTLKIEYLDENYFVDVFEGMHCQTGTYLESTKAFSEGIKTHTINDVELQNLVMIDAYILQIPLQNLMKKDDKPYISLNQIKEAEKESIPNNSSILVATGYGKLWESQDYVEKC
jgi:kynurenine formamidase